MGEMYQSVVLFGKKNIRVKAFLDSGASTTYINDELIDELGYTKIKREYVELGNGKRIVGYKVPIGLIVRGRIKSIMATAISMPDKLILGHDFFQDNDVVLDYGKDKFRFSKRIPKVNRRLRL
jgi:hypothetical protein